MKFPGLNVTFFGFADRPSFGSHYWKFVLEGAFNNQITFKLVKYEKIIVAVIFDMGDHAPVELGQIESHIVIFIAHLVQACDGFAFFGV